MKINSKLLSILVVVTAFWSCDDEITEIEPFVNGNPETFFNSPQSFQNGVDGIYSQFYNYYSAESGYQAVPDILADNVILATTGRRSNEVFYDWRYTANSGGLLSLAWSEAYEAINVANLVIGQIDNLPEGENRNNILGQALAARAIAHFDLVRLYAKIPTQSSDANQSLGVVYMKVEDGDTDDPFAEHERETVASNYQEIIGDLEAAAAIIGDNNAEGRLDRDAVYGILSRVYLYNGQYQEVVDAANEVSAEMAIGSQLGEVYGDVTNAGLLIEWAVNTSSEASFNNVGVSYSQTIPPDTRSEYVASFEFQNMIDTADARSEVLTYQAFDGEQEYNAVGKFLGELQAGGVQEVNGLVDIKVLRVAEVVLNKAEALYRLDRPGDALAALNELRDLRYENYSGGETGQALLDAILEERRIELAFEGHRFFDLKRRGEAIVRENFGDLADGTGTPPEELVLPAGDPRFQFAIPQAEINANSNLEQNPGY